MPLSRQDRSRHHVLAQLTGLRPVAPGVPAERRQGRDRRRHSLWSFLYGGIRPRRREGRRQNDHREIFVDWHEPRVLYLVLGIVLMSCADALFTLNLLALGAEEANVFMEALIGRDVSTFLRVKIGMTAVSVVLLAVAAKRHFLGMVPVLRLLQLFCAGYATLIVYELYLFWVILSPIYLPGLERILVLGG
jgi:hypothetical protein